MRFPIWIVLVLLSLSAFAQSTHYNFSRLDTYTGLSHNQVIAILKDSDGFVWFGTMSGLNRYDGYSSRIFRKTYNDSSSLLDNSIQSLYELPDERMWVVTNGGACIYNSHTEKFDADYYGYLQSLGLPSGPITNIVRGSNGRYWFLYDNADLYLYSATDKKAKSFRQHSGLNSSGKIISIKETKDGKLWLLYQNGFLQQYDINLNKLIFSSAALQNLNKALAYDMDVRTAVDAPRYHHQWLPDSVTFEDRAIPDSTIARLNAMGHAVRVRGRQGDAHTIRYDGKARTAHGANDQRSPDSKASVP